MHLLVDLLAFVDVRPLVREERLHLADAEEWPAPQNRRLGLQSQIREVFVVLLAHFAIDLEKAIYEFTRTIRIQFGHDLLKERVFDRQVSRTELFRKHLVPEASGGLGARWIAGVHDGHGVGWDIPWEREQRKTLRRVRIGLSRHREASERVLADSDACLGPVAGDRERHEFTAALIDVVLRSVGGHSGRTCIHVYRR